VHLPATLLSNFVSAVGTFILVSAAVMSLQSVAPPFLSRFLWQFVIVLRTVLANLPPDLATVARHFCSAESKADEGCGSAVVTRPAASVAARRNRVL